MLHDTQTRNEMMNLVNSELTADGDRTDFLDWYPNTIDYLRDFIRPREGWVVSQTLYEIFNGLPNCSVSAPEVGMLSRTGVKRMYVTTRKGEAVPNSGQPIEIPVGNSTMKERQLNKEDPATEHDGVGPERAIAFAEERAPSTESRRRSIAKHKKETTETLESDMSKPIERTDKMTQGNEVSRSKALRTHHCIDMLDLESLRVSEHLSANRSKYHEQQHHTLCTCIRFDIRMSWREFTKTPKRYSN